MARPRTGLWGTRYIRLTRSLLGIGALAAHERYRLMLLGLPPDMVHGLSLRETGPSTPLTRQLTTHRETGGRNSPLL